MSVEPFLQFLGYVHFYNVYEMIINFNCCHKKKNFKIYSLGKISEEYL